MLARRNLGLSLLGVRLAFLAVLKIQCESIVKFQAKRNWHGFYLNFHLDRLRKVQTLIDLVIAMQ